MTKLLTYIIIFSYTATGTFVLGEFEPLKYSLVAEWKNEQLIGCERFDGITHECTQEERDRLQYLKINK